MKRWIKWFVVVAAIVGAAIQFVPVARTNPPVTGDIPAPPEIRTLLRNACYDCHSHEAVWPWYSRVAPVSWLVAHDVDEGREHLNFSTWTDYKPKKQAMLLAGAAEEIEEGEMPLALYVWMHPEARLTDAQKEQLTAWMKTQSAE